MHIQLYPLPSCTPPGCSWLWLQSNTFKMSSFVVGFKTKPPSVLASSTGQVCTYQHFKCSPCHLFASAQLSCQTDSSGSTFSSSFKRRLHFQNKLTKLEFSWMQLIPIFHFRNRESMFDNVVVIVVVVVVDIVIAIVVFEVNV